MEPTPKKPFIHKVRELPEDQKKAIFFIIMGICVVVMAVFAIWSTKNNMAELSRSVQNVNEPN